MAAYPNMTDSSCLSATSRWVGATLKLADQYAAAGQYCKAGNYFSDAFKISNPLNNAAYPTATAVDNQCNGGGATHHGSPTPQGTATPTENGTVPTETLVPPTDVPTTEIPPTVVPPTSTPSATP
jgi:hypothetical protein